MNPYGDLNTEGGLVGPNTFLLRNCQLHYIQTPTTTTECWTSTQLTDFTPTLKFMFYIYFWKLKKKVVYSNKNIFY